MPWTSFQPIEVLYKDSVIVVGPSVGPPLPARVRYTYSNSTLQGGTQ